MKKTALLILSLMLVIPLVSAALDNCFAVMDTDVPARVSPGDTFHITATVRNYDLDDLETVNVFIASCPEGWFCENRTLAYDREGEHLENISITVPESALPTKYTVSVRLESEWQTVRGDDRVVISVVPASEKEIVPYDEYVPEETVDVDPRADAKKALEPVTGEIFEDDVNETEETNVVLDVVEDVLPINATGIVNNVERLQTSSQFREYASVALIIVLVFLASGAYAALRKSKDKK